ncbi:MAG: CBS domain-containing protein, partial [Spirochaetes bacterium]|nr:CBS domain-containing protein [Spirochaetota bacterium]
MSDKDAGRINDSDDMEAVNELLKEFTENPFDPDKKTPADVMRIFFLKNVPIVPVISRRNVLIGIITRESITAEMSDIDRFSSCKIDRFVTKIAVKMGFDQILQYISKTKEFTVINIFGEIQGTWSRLELLAACENSVLGKNDPESEIISNREDQVMEWMIYLILEHIPRAIFAMNDKGKTIFYNSFFEDIILKNTESDEVNIPELEKNLTESSLNDYFFRDKEKKDMYFYNKAYDFHYEKVPMFSHGKPMGYLIFCLNEISESYTETELLSNSKMNLKEKIEAFERHLLVEEIQNKKMDMKSAARELCINEKNLLLKL